jgi:hypothetical protein
MPTLRFDTRATWRKDLDSAHGTILAKRVEGYSSLLWMLLLAGAARLGIDVLIASKVLGISAALVVIAALVWRPDDRPAFLAGLFLALYVPFLLYAAVSMETVAFTSLVTLALVGPASWQPAIAPLLIAIRPEGALVAAVDVLALAWRPRAPAMDRRNRRRRGTDVHCDRDSPMGDLPRARAQHLLREGGGWRHRTCEARRRVRRRLDARAPAGRGLCGDWGARSVARARSPRTHVPGVAGRVRSLHGERGGDPPSAFPLWRQFVHITPAWLLLAMTGLTRLVPHRPWKQVAAVVALALAADLGILLVQGRGGPRPGAVDYVAWLASLSTPTTTISSSYGGALPFIVDAVHIDALGLNTPYIARHGTFDADGPQDSKTDMRWVVEQRPDIIEGYLSGKALLAAAIRMKSSGRCVARWCSRWSRRRASSASMSSSATARTIGWIEPRLCAPTSAPLTRGAPCSSACRSARLHSPRLQA